MTTGVFEIAQDPSMGSDTLTDDFRSDVRAFEILSERGLDSAGIDLIKNQVGRLSIGYRRPELKLADVLAGGAWLCDDVSLLLLHGFGGLDRDGSSGDCSESVRAMTSEWARSSQHEQLADLGLSPFYLEVAAPRLFTDIWDNGSRIRSGHTVLAIGSPKDYLGMQTDESFVLIDPTLGVIQPLAGSSYKQTGFMVVPEYEQRPQVIPLAIRDSPDTNSKRPTFSELVLGIDEAARFVYTLCFKHTSHGPAAQIQILEGSKTIALFDSTTGETQRTIVDPSVSEQAENKFNELINTLVKCGIEIHNEVGFDGESIIINDETIKLTKELRYPRDKRIEPYASALELAAAKATSLGLQFSL